MATWLTFTGMTIMVESDKDTPKHEIASLARKEFIERVQAGLFKLTDVGVTDIEVMSSEIFMDEDTRAWGNR